MSRHRREHVVSVRLTIGERVRLSQLAAAAGLTESEYLRRAISSTPPVERMSWPAVMPHNTAAIAPGYAYAAPINTTGHVEVSRHTASVWQDGTVGPNWPGAA